MPWTIGILSDLHVGPHACGADLCPDQNHNAPEEDYLANFESFVSTKDIALGHLILPGDFAETARPAELRLASTQVGRIAAALSVPEENLFLVPGNHDVDWAVLQLDSDDTLRRAQRYDPIRQAGGVLQNAIARSEGDLFADPYLASWHTDELLVVGYNSSWDDDPDAAVHTGFLAHGHVAALDDHLRQFEWRPDQLRVFVVHHHPFLYSDPVPGAPDFSALQNAELLLDSLATARFDILIHGHRHHPRLHTLQRNAAHPLVILAAGSFSLSLPPIWAGRICNQFHVLEIDKRDTATEVVAGRLRTWSYLFGEGWCEGRATTGIRHVEPFGQYALPAEIAAKVGAALESLLPGRDWCQWSDLVALDPTLQYLPFKSVQVALQSHSARLGLRLHGDTLDDLIVLRE